MQLLQKLSKLGLLVCFLAGSTFSVAQELNGVFTVNVQRISQPDQPIFKTLQNSVQEFLNNTKWTKEDFEDVERINYAIVLDVLEYDNDRFRANLEISMTRPVFNAGYTTPTFNYRDQQVTFEYIEFAPLFYNENQYENNLASLLSFYVYTMLGVDGDTFALRGGQKYHEEAQRIVNLAQGAQIEGWRPQDGLISRFRLNDDMLSETYKEYRDIMYNYHRKGLDIFASDAKKAKTELVTQIKNFEALQSRRPNSLLQRIFFDAKAPEIASIFSGGPVMDTRELKGVLQKLSPTQSSSWRIIK